MTRKIVVFMLSVLLCLAAVPVQAQASVSSNIATVPLTLNVAEQISISSNASSSGVTFTGNPNGTVSVSPASFSVTTTWTLGSGHTFFVGAAYFTTQIALTGSAGSVNASAIFGSINGGTAAACIQNFALGSASQSTNSCGYLFNLTTVPAGQGTRTDTVALTIPTLPTLGGGSAAGVLTLQADAS